MGGQALASSSWAALLVKVIIKMDAGETPSSSKDTARCTRTLVLPVPGPARTKRGAPRCSTALACSGLSPSLAGSRGVSMGSGLLTALGSGHGRRGILRLFARPLRGQLPKSLLSLYFLAVGQVEKPHHPELAVETTPSTRTSPARMRRTASARTGPPTRSMSSKGAWRSTKSSGPRLVTRECTICVDFFGGGPLLDHLGRHLGQGHHGLERPGLGQAWLAKADGRPSPPPGS